jgi:hypothetical protein
VLVSVITITTTPKAVPVAHTEDAEAGRELSAAE